MGFFCIIWGKHCINTGSTLITKIFGAPWNIVSLAGECPTVLTLILALKPRMLWSWHGPLEMSFLEAMGLGFSGPHPVDQSLDGCAPGERMSPRVIPLVLPLFIDDGFLPVFWHGRRGQETLWVSLRRALIPFGTAPVLMTYPPPTGPAPPPNIIPLGLSFQHMNFEGLQSCLSPEEPASSSPHCP